MIRQSDAPEEVSLTISTETVIKVILMIIGTIILLAALRKAAHALLLVFTAFFLALALNAPVSWVAHHLPGRTRGSRALGTTISFVVVVVVLGSFLALMIPPIAKQTSSLI